MRLLRLITAVLLLIQICSGFEVSPQTVRPGEDITLSGIASPGERVQFRSSFSMDLPVVNGMYGYESTVEIPQKPNRFSVSVKNVQDLSVGVRMGIWITKRIEASGGSVSLSQRDVPPGRYTLKLFGNALPGARYVKVDVAAETEVRADQDGKYRLVIDTSGVPEGEYRIESSGDVKVVRITTGSDGDYDRVPPAVSERRSEEPERVRGEVSITPEVVRWYANLSGLKVENSSQYQEVESLLRRRLEGGYWKIIRRGEPLTEQAGDCEDEYCLVRGVGACTSCREKDLAILRARSGVSEGVNASRTNGSIDSSTENIQSQASGRGIRAIIDWLLGLLRILWR
ncbi:hypothetical protein [Methanothrix sp.]|uniref:hypothetical protein n=1 Tax=Methanothrix sp. TaxID=90426 RepID=UPI0034E1F433